MAKKTFASGIDSMIQTTVERKQPDKIENKEIELIGIHVKIPAQSKKKIDIYCAENGIKKQDFFIQLVNDFFK